MLTAAAALAVVLGAVAQSVSGIGFVLVCGPLLVTLLGQPDGVRLAVVLSSAVNVVVLAREHRAVVLRDALTLLLPAALATPLLAVALRRLDPQVAAAGAGLAAVLGATALASGVRWQAAKGRAGAVGAGLISALMNVLAGIGGPAVALWAANAGWSARTARSTLQVYFLGLNLVALASLGLPHVSGTLFAATATALAVGLGLGHLLEPRVPEVAAQRATLALAAAGGLTVLLSSLL